MTNLSFEAKCILALIKENTEFDDNGNLSRYWCPDQRRNEESIRLMKCSIIIGGPGHAKILKSLESKGLTRRPRRDQPYMFAITEDGIRLYDEVLFPEFYKEEWRGEKDE